MQTVAVRDMVNTFAQEATGKIATVMDLYAEVLKSNYRNRRRRMNRVNQIVAADVRERVLVAYDQRVKSGRSGPSGYRANAPGKWKRYAGGKMELGLEDPGFINTGFDGINFANMNVLDRYAKQWYRLNFGAGPRGQGGGRYRPGEYRLNLFGQATGAPVSLKQYKASAAYRVPAGLFFDPNTGSVQNLSGSRRRRDIFQPKGAPVEDKLRKKLSNRQGRSYGLVKSGTPVWKGGMSRGFAGYHFLDAGVRRLAGIWPLAMLRLIEEWVEEASQVQTGPVALTVPTSAQLDANLAVISRELDRLSNQDKYAGILARLGR